MKLVVTGADGFLGWHLRCRLKALGDHTVVPINRSNFGDLASALIGADAVVHIAGLNRATDVEVVDGNIALASSVANAIKTSGARPRILFANSIQAGNGTPYGDGKSAASDLLRTFADDIGLDFIDVLLPNLFGEHGRPGYNSFVATFCREVAAGRESLANDNQVDLLHVQDAAQALIDGLEGASRVDRPSGETRGVIEVLDLLKSFETTYRSGDMPNLDSKFKVNLFNTYRAEIFLDQAPIRFTKHSDSRGSFVETVKVHGGGGQTSFSTTTPGITRGEHFHLQKIERFVVIGGKARIGLRRLFTDEIVLFDVDGKVPVAIDMPTNWVHNITNTGDTELFTLLWSNGVFDPNEPDTYPEPVDLSLLADKVDV